METKKLFRELCEQSLLNKNNGLLQNFNKVLSYEVELH